ncbi:MAG TPA: AMP-binding protein, partial [Candidatus Binatia bacterium]|nr:AMP-binding protein [Candidatus Binatia bacterium]
MPETIFHSVAAQAEQHPNAVALEAPGRKPLTYTRLRDQMGYVVEVLNSHCIGRGDRVAVVLPGGSDLATVSLGVLAGATLAPLNPEFKLTEFEYLLDSLDAKLLITQAGLDSPARAAAQTKRIAIVELAATSESIA